MATPTKKRIVKKTPTTKTPKAPKAVGTLEAPIYTSAGTATGTITLPEAIFGQKWNGDLVHQVVIGMQANTRKGTAHTKDRGEVRGGGKKPWRQKGTGRARHGSSRSPIWIGGGVTHGPRNDKDYSQKINKKMRTKALFTALSAKFRDGEILFIDALSFTTPKTKDARTMLSAFGKIAGFAPIATRDTNAALIAMPQKTEGVVKSFRNFGNIAVDEVRNLNPVDVLSYKYLIFVTPAESIKVLEGRKGTKVTA